jgi:hypothetical protein
VPGTDFPHRFPPGTDFPGEIASFRRPVSECLAPISQAFFDVDGMLECKRI